MNGLAVRFLIRRLGFWEGNDFKNSGYGMGHGVYGVSKNGSMILSGRIVSIAIITSLPA